MRAIEYAAQSFQEEIRDSGLVSPNGEISDWSALGKIIEVDYLFAMVVCVENSMSCYVNGKLADLVDVPHGYIGQEDGANLSFSFDPPSLMHVMDVIEHFRCGQDSPRQGVLTLVPESRGDPLICEDMAVVIGTTSRGRVTYYLHIFGDMAQMDIVNAHAIHDLSPLTARQHETLRYLLQGKSYPEIAVEMGISVKTLEKHVKAIYDQTNCQNQATLIHSCNRF